MASNQHIKTLDGYVIPLDIINGLPYLEMMAPSKHEIDELPHVILMPPDAWDPHVLDHTLTDKQDWYATLNDLDDGLIKTPFDACGNYLH